MKQTHFLVFLFLFLNLFLAAIKGDAQLNKARGHIEVSMRMIGHEVLLHSGDSISRVLPIKKEENRFRIQFENEFAFNPEDVVTIVDSIILKTKISKSYLVELIKCETKEVIHSFEKGKIDSLDVIPCGTRAQPLGCYEILISIYDKVAWTDNSLLAKKKSDNGMRSFWGIIAGIIALFFFGLLFFFWRKKQNITLDPDVILIGKYQLNKRNMKLTFGKETVELTSKEADLLAVLYDFVNNTIEREVILKTVWGDEGDYVGRTLDVFISKLRKKLDNDSDVRIVNVRGVGYRLVVE